MVSTIQLKIPKKNLSGNFGNKSLGGKFMKKENNLNANELNEEKLGTVSGGTGDWVVYGFVEDDLGNVYKLNNDRKSNLQKLNAVIEQDNAAAYKIQNNLNRALNK